MYTFAEDQKPGDAKGQGIKGVGTWTAVTVSANSSSSAPASSGGGVGGSGYELPSGRELSLSGRQPASRQAEQMRCGERARPGGYATG
ncbi:MAG: hypothetical protein ABSG95_11480 [Solirubrobacteraceae bacterium]